MRVVNVVDLMTLFPRDVHPHGMNDDDFVELFTADKPTSSSPFTATSARSTSSCTAGPNAERFHVRGFNEEGTTTTPFDMVVLNGMSRFHLCKEVLRRCRRSIPNADTLIRRCDAQLARHHDYVREHLDDMPEIRDWTWTP